MASHLVNEINFANGKNDKSTATGRQLQIISTLKSFDSGLLVSMGALRLFIIETYHRI